MVAGSASDTVLAQVRPHLRGCQSCQATVRALHAADHSLGALAPVVLVGAAVPVSSDLPERATGFLSRLHDVVAAHLGDRAAVATMKAQPLLEVSTATKVAAVAASAAVVAGGGVAVHEQTDRPSSPKPQVRQAERPPAAPSSPVVASISATTSSRSTAVAVRAQQQSKAGRQVTLSTASQRRERIEAERAARAAARRRSARRASEQFDPDLTPAPRSTSPVAPPSRQFTPTAPANPLAPPPTSSTSTGASPSSQFSKPSNQFG